jgi:hypothetical protein
MGREMLGLEGEALPRLRDPGIPRAFGPRPRQPFVDELAGELGDRDAARPGLLGQGSLALAPEVADVQRGHATPP